MFLIMPDSHARYPVQSLVRATAAIRVAEQAISMRDAINLVRQQTTGRILDAQDRGDHYRVKVLSQDGVVRVYRVDAKSGAVR